MVRERKANPRERSYVCSLIARGEDRILRKITEEAFEVVLATKCETPDRQVSEIADLIFHILVLIGSSDAITLDAIRRELETRRG